MTRGRLRCTHCGQTFLVKDGQQIKIDHFNDCPGATDEFGGDPHE